MKVTEQTTVLEILQKHHNAIEVFKQYNLDCPFCKGQIHESIRNVIKNCGLDGKQFIEDLNNAVK